MHPSGHASDSLSIATGLAKARQLKGTDEKVVALIGDASLAGGMAFEALNYMGKRRGPNRKSDNLPMAWKIAPMPPR